MKRAGPIREARRRKHQNEGAREPEKRAKRVSRCRIGRGFRGRPDRPGETEGLWSGPGTPETVATVSIEGTPDPAGEPGTPIPHHPLPGITVNTGPDDETTVRWE